MVEYTPQNEIFIMSDSDISNFDPAVTLTPPAIEHVTKYIAQRGKGLGIRLAAVPDGCNGYKYVTDFVDAENEDDKVFPFSDDLAVYVDRKSLLLVAGN